MVSVALSLVTVTGCSKLREQHPDWIIRSSVVFMADDLGSKRAAPPRGSYHLVFPYIAGDLYGPTTTGEFVHPLPDADLRFEMDLNQNHELLLKSLEPTEFSLPYLKVEPADARLARLAPTAMQTDGIEQIGRTDWVDLSSKRRVLLVFVDRAARITGRTVANDRPLRYDVRVASPGYVWIERRSDADEDVYVAVPRPAQLVLAVTPGLSDRPQAVSPVRTDTPVR
jgi:hypothetical protein